MTYENSLIFGKNASIINEAYSKMYLPSRGRSKTRSINEATDNTPSDDEINRLGLELNDEQREYIKNFNPDREYREIIAAERKGDTESAEVAGDIDKDSTSSSDTTQDVDDDDEDTQNFMQSFSSRSDTGGGIADDDFFFSSPRETKPRYPEWLVRAAAAAGHELPELEDAPKSSHVRAKYVEKPSKSSDVVDEGNPWDNLWENVISANPDVFNDERYDMGELGKHKKEIYEKWLEFAMRGVDEVDAVERALEEIPGCECKVKDIVGDIDDEDVVGDIDDGQQDTAYVSPWKRGGYGVVVKGYEKDYAPGSGSEGYRYIVRYITPDSLKGVTFETQEEAVAALRDYLSTLVGDPKDVCIGVVIDNDVMEKIHSGNGYETMKDANGNVVVFKNGISKGKPRMIKLKPDVYTISTSDEYNTDLAIKYETSDWKHKNFTDEYLQ